MIDPESSPELIASCTGRPIEPDAAEEGKLPEEYVGAQPIADGQAYWAQGIGKLADQFQRDVIIRRYVFQCTVKGLDKG